MKYFNDINLNGNQIVKGKFESVDSLPTTELFNGRMVFNESDNFLYIYKNNKWVSIPDAEVIGDISSILETVVEVP